MSTIATKTGDRGTTALVGGTRVSKASLRVETYGTVDELGAVLGFARSICNDSEVAGWTEEIQRSLFRVGSALSTPTAGRPAQPVVTAADVANLDALVDRIEATDGILSDWSLPGAHRDSAAYEIARTVCRRLERLMVRLMESGGESGTEAPESVVLPDVLTFVNRLSDLLWLFGRLIEVRAGIDARLRDETKAGPNFSRAW